MIPNSFSIGPLTFHIYGLIISSAVVIGWHLAKKRANFYKIKPALLDHPLMLLSLILGVVGGRIYHVLDKWGYYKSNPDQIIQVSGGGLGIFGALIGIFAGLWIFARIKKVKLLSLLDLLAPSIILGQAIGRIGNYINQEGFGPPTSLPWGVYIDPAHRPEQYMFFTHFHPTFFYEAVLNLVAFYILLKLSSKLAKPGQILGLYLVLYGIIRFIVEFWRIDTAIVDEIKAAHILSLISTLSGIFLVKAKSLSYWSGRS